MSQISFLGYVISQDGIQMEPKQVSAIIDWPLTKTGQSPTGIYWMEEALKCFDRLNKLVCFAPILVHPDPEAPFIVEMDASEMGVGAVLSQRLVTDNKVHPEDSRRWSGTMM